MNNDEKMPVTVISDDEGERDYSSKSVMAQVVSAKDGIEEKPKYQKPKLKGKAAIENFFYHYKTALIAIAAFVVLAVIVTVMSLPKRKDLTVMVYVNEDIGSQGMEAMGAELERYCEDFDGNGKISVAVRLYNKDSKDISIATAGVNAIENDLSGGSEAYIIIADKENLEFIKKCHGDDVFEKNDGIETSWSKLLSGEQAEDDDSVIFINLLPLTRSDEKSTMRYESAKKVMESIKSHL